MMFSRYRIVAAVTIVLLLFVFVARPPQAKAQFVLASWSFPDDYGQGIDTIGVSENSTGEWLAIGNYDYDEESSLEWNESVAIRLKCWTWFNSTLTGADNPDDGKNYLRHNVIVTTSNGTQIFSQQNFTYSHVYTEGHPMWHYGYNVILEFLPVAGEIYTVTITYEVFF